MTNLLSQPRYKNINTFLITTSPRRQLVVHTVIAGMDKEPGVSKRAAEFLQT